MIAHKYKNTDIYYRGLYEFDFLEKYFEHFTIFNAPSFTYIIGEKMYKYFPDFYIPEYNLIVEIKSSWIIKQQDPSKLKYKEYVVKNNDYNYILIVDKKYNEFEKLINF